MDCLKCIWMSVLKVDSGSGFWKWMQFCVWDVTGNRHFISNLAGICVGQTYSRSTPTIKMAIVCVGLTHAQPLQIFNSIMRGLSLHINTTKISYITVGYLRTETNPLKIHLY